MRTLLGWGVGQGTGVNNRKWGCVFYVVHSNGHQVDPTMGVHSHAMKKKGAMMRWMQIPPKAPLALKNEKQHGPYFLSSLNRPYFLSSFTVPFYSLSTHPFPLISYFLTSPKSLYFVSSFNITTSYILSSQILPCIHTLFHSSLLYPHCFSLPQD